MTEQEWLTSDNPQRMLSWLGGVYPVGGSGTDELGQPCALKVTDRKLRLFACACTRRLWGQLPDLARRAVEAGESFADGRLTSKGRGLAMNAADRTPADDIQSRTRAYACLRSDAATGAREAISFLGTKAIFAGQAVLLRDVVGNPWRPVDSPYEWVPSRWGGEYEFRKAWLTPQVLSLATATYEERLGRECEECDGGFLPKTGMPDAGMVSRCPDCHGTGRIEDGLLDPAHLAVLSDALEEAGCDSVDMLCHLRSPGPHVRGCWAIDHVLGKE